MAKTNCWVFKKCGRQSGGIKAGELGVCIAATDAASNGKNGGWNAGRFCWAVAGTLCGGKVQGSFAQKALNCAACDFFLQVKKEEGNNFTYKP